MTDKLKKMDAIEIKVEINYIKKYLTPLTHFVVTYRDNLKSATSKGPMVPKKISHDSIDITKREKCEEKLKQIQIKRCKSINELDEN